MNKTIYKHTQIGYLTIYLMILVIILFLISYIQNGFLIDILFIEIFLLIILTSFTTLTVTLNNKYIKIKYGYGVFNKKFLIKNIKSVKSVKNKWYYGWGIRIWFWPKMWIYNISGFDAAELKMKNNKIYRIGTDDCKNLLSVLQTKTSI